MTRSRVVRAYAKFNPVLAVGAKRDDGYHEVVNVMQTIDLHDTLHIEFDEGTEADGFAVEVEVVNDDMLTDTLVTDAISLWRTACFFARQPVWGTVRVQLTKEIPVEAGLGGGSSDAAAALRTINELAGTVLAHEDLLDVAARIGSDVPFFLSPTGSAVATGRGESIQVLDPLPQRRFVVVWPGAGASTAAVYGNFDPSTAPPLPSPTDAEAGAIDGAWRNDLASSARTTVPKLDGLLAAYEAAGHTVMVAGSGSAVVVSVRDDLAVDAVSAVATEVGAAFMRHVTTVHDPMSE